MASPYVIALEIVAEISPLSMTSIYAISLAPRLRLPAAAHLGASTGVKTSAFRLAGQGKGDASVDRSHGVIDQQ